MAKKTSTVMVTGSSGYVASELIPLLSENFDVFGVDNLPSSLTTTVIDISSSDFHAVANAIPDEGLSVVNLAAARFDFGASAREYYRLNVECHAEFLKSLSDLRVTKFIHVSSVAAFDGKDIPYTEELNCDDAYRSTKYLQDELIQNWCYNKDIELTVVYPSAIFSRDARSDTNIGKLQFISKFLPFIPTIPVVKSLTYLPNFSRFIAELVGDEIPAGKYLTIERPLLTVSRMIQLISGRPILLIWVPFLPIFLKMVAQLLYVLGFCGKIDLKLTPNRVIKLFTDTSYSYVSFEGIDIEEYANNNCEQLSEILSKI